MQGFRISRNGRSGLSVAELMVACSLLFLVLMYVLSSFLASHHYVQRGQEYSTALFLCQSKMEQLQVTPTSELTASQGQFPAPFEGFRYSVDLQDWEGELKELVVLVHSPRGAKATLRTLRLRQVFFGVVTDPATNSAVFSSPRPPYLERWDDANGILEAVSHPDLGQRFSGLAGHPGSNLMFAATSDSGEFLSHRASEPMPWSSAFSAPNSPGLGPSQTAGLAMDRTGSLLVIADWANRGLWVHSDGIPGLANGFLTDRPLAPSSPPLGIPAGVATDGTGTVVWVADTENQALRKLLIRLDQGRPPEDYEPDELEVAPPLGYWSKEIYRFPQGMGAPQGVACDLYGGVVYTADRAYLYRLEEERPGEVRWLRFSIADQAPDLSRAGPSGLAFDEFNNLVFIATKDGQLWKFEASTHTFGKITP